MASFLGLKVRVTMKDNLVLEGVIAFVDNELMKLSNVYKPSDPKRGIVSEMLINSVNIKNLEVMPNAEAPKTNTTNNSSNSNTHLLAPDNLLTPNEFISHSSNSGARYIDPAIVSMSNNSRAPPQQQQPFPPQQHQQPKTIRTLAEIEAEQLSKHQNQQHQQHQQNQNQHQNQHQNQNQHQHQHQQQQFQQNHSTFANKSPHPHYQTYPPQPPAHFQQQQQQQQVSFQEQRQQGSPMKQYNRGNNSSPARNNSNYKSPSKKFQVRDQAAFGKPVSGDMYEDFDFEESNAKFNKAEIFKEMKKVDFGETGRDETPPQTHSTVLTSVTTPNNGDYVISSKLSKQPRYSARQQAQQTQTTQHHQQPQQTQQSQQTTQQTQQLKQTHSQQQLPQNNSQLNAKQPVQLTKSQQSMTSPSLLIPSFRTESNKIVPAVTPATMHELWKITRENGPTQYQIMENAGRSLAQIALKFLKGKEGSKVVVLAGAGCTGATGLCAARHLANHQVQVIACMSRGYQLSDEAIAQRNLYKQSGGREGWQGSLPVETVDLIIDALVGIGLRGSITGPTITLIQWANAQGAPILSLEMPSGVDPNTGKRVGASINAQATMAIALPKCGHHKEVTGQLYVADVGIPTPSFKKAGVEDYVPFFEDSFVIKLHSHRK